MSHLPPFECPHCGGEVGEPVRTCPYCGRPLKWDSARVRAYHEQREGPARQPASAPGPDQGFGGETPGGHPPKQGARQLARKVKDFFRRKFQRRGRVCR